MNKTYRKRTWYSILFALSLCSIYQNDLFAKKCTQQIFKSQKQTLPRKLTEEEVRILKFLKKFESIDQDLQIGNVLVYTTTK